MELTHSKLRGRIVEKYGTYKNFAKAIGTSEQTVNAKLSGKSGFSEGNIVAWSNALEIREEEVGAFYFTQKLSKN